MQTKLTGKSTLSFKKSENCGRPAFQAQAPRYNHKTDVILSILELLTLKGEELLRLLKLVS